MFIVITVLIYVTYKLRNIHKSSYFNDKQHSLNVLDSKPYLDKVDLSIHTKPSGIKQKPPLLDIQLFLLDFLPWQSLDNKKFYEQ